MRSSGRKTIIGALAVLALAACGRGEPGGASEPERFLAENARQEGVETLPSGVQYRVVRAGSPDGVQPDSNDLVVVHYEGRLLDDTVFDSSYRNGRPVSMYPDQLIPAWPEAIPHMRVGDEWTLWVPPEQGYGAEGAGPIPPDSVLVFRIELLDVAPIPGGTPAGAARG